MRSGRRLSSKQQANLFIMPIARSVAPNSNAPASEVTGPASNAATTLRPSTGANSKKFGVQSVGIGVLRESEINCCCTTIFADSQPRCTQFGERSALDDPRVQHGPFVRDHNSPRKGNPRDNFLRIGLGS